MFYWDDANKVATGRRNLAMKNPASILITGGSSGIGFAIAETCLSFNAQVCIVGRSEERMHECLVKWSKAGHEVHGIPVDITTMEGRDEIDPLTVEKVNLSEGHHLLHLFRNYVIKHFVRDLIYLRFMLECD